jgi:hypothetical protein
MRLVSRHPAPFVLVLSAFATIAAVFAFARPQYHPLYESKMIDFSKQHYYSPQAVRQTFTQQGIVLRKSNGASGFTVFSTTRQLKADDLQVLVAPRNGKGSWGPKLEPYDERFGNVAVMYGGHDARLLERVKSGVASLRNA